MAKMSAGYLKEITAYNYLKNVPHPDRSSRATNFLTRAAASRVSVCCTSAVRCLRLRSQDIKRNIIPALHTDIMHAVIFICI